MRTGKLSLKRRIEEYNAANLSTGSAKRAANIIRDIQNSEVLHLQIVLYHVFNSEVLQTVIYHAFTLTIDHQI